MLELHFWTKDGGTDVLPGGNDRATAEALALSVLHSQCPRGLGWTLQCVFDGETLSKLEMVDVDEPMMSVTIVESEA